MWYKLYADGTEIDIIYANSPTEAIAIGKARHGEAIWTWKHY